MSRVLLVGATGLIGSCFIEKLCLEHSVTVLGRSQLSVDGVDWIAHDLANSINRDLLPQNLDSIVYLAQSEHFRDFPEHVTDVFQINTVRVLELLDFARQTNVKNFICASSGGVYGAGDASFTEASPINADAQLGFYLSTKLCAEILAENFSSLMRLVTIRFFFVYGENQKRSMLIPRLVDNIRQGVPVYLEGVSGLKINPTHVSDAVGALMAALYSNVSGKFNVAGPEILSLRDICDEIGRKLGKEPKFDVNENVIPRNIIGDISKLKNELYVPVVGFSEGVTSLLDVENCRH